MAGRSGFAPLMRCPRQTAWTGQRGGRREGRQMYRIDYTDLVGGVLLVALGAGVSLVAIQYYPLGT